MLSSSKKILLGDDKGEFKSKYNFLPYSFGELKLLPSVWLSNDLFKTDGEMSSSLRLSMLS